MFTIGKEGDLGEPLLLPSSDDEEQVFPSVDDGRDDDAYDDDDDEGRNNVRAPPSSTPRHYHYHRHIRASLALLFVSFLFATLNVSLRYLYTMPNPATPPEVNMTRGWFTCLFFLPLLVARKYRKGCSGGSSSTVAPDSITATIATTTIDNHASSSSSSSYRPLWVAAGELAIWNTLGQVFVNVGLLTTPSARASFLGQTQIVIVPLICVVMGGRQAMLRKQDILGCLFSIVGVFLLSSSSTSGGSGSGLSIHFGDFWILASAVCFSLYLIRVGHLAPHYDEIFLQGTKNTIMALLYSLWFAGSVLQQSSESSLSSSLAVLAKSSSSSSAAAAAAAASTSWMAWSIIAYTAFGPGCLADVLQQRAQEIVPPTESNLILCSSSVFTAILSRILLGEETSFLEKVGGAFLIAGAIVAGSTTLI